MPVTLEELEDKLNDCYFFLFNRKQYFSHNYYRTSDRVDPETDEMFLKRLNLHVEKEVSRLALIKIELDAVGASYAHIVEDYRRGGVIDPFPELTEIFGCSFEA